MALTIKDFTERQIKDIEELTNTHHNLVNDDEVWFYPNKDRGDASSAFFFEENYATKKLDIYFKNWMWLSVEHMIPLTKILRRDND